MKVIEFEKAIFEVEEVVVRVRAAQGVEVGDYDYERKAAHTTSVADWLAGRVVPCLNGLQVSVIDGTFTSPHGRTKMGTLRSSYER